MCLLRRIASRFKHRVLRRLHPTDLSSFIDPQAWYRIEVEQDQQLSIWLHRMRVEPWRPWIPLTNFVILHLLLHAYAPLSCLMPVLSSPLHRRCA